MASLEVKAGISAGSVVGLGGAYLGARLLIRNVVYDTLITEYNYPSIKKLLDGVVKPYGGNLNLPDAQSFADALVPLWSLSSPFAAIEDVLKKGRKSEFWPAKFKKTPKGGKLIEDALFKAMRAAYYTPADATAEEMGRTALTTFTVEYAKARLASKG
jgi:hypothetical protein